MLGIYLFEKYFYDGMLFIITYKLGSIKVLIIRGILYSYMRFITQKFRMILFIQDSVLGETSYFIYSECVVCGAHISIVHSRIHHHHNHHQSEQ